MEIKTKNSIDLRETLKTFEVGEGRFIPYSISNMETSTMRARYHALKRDGLINGDFRFAQEKSKKGTIVTRMPE